MNQLLEQNFATHRIETPVGDIDAQWDGAGKLCSCSFASHVETCPEQATEDTTCSLATAAGELVQQRQQELQRSFENYFRTGQLCWDLELLDWSPISPFHQRVLRRCAAIPSGLTMSYAELARCAGSPLAARAVGSAMARNPWPLIVPCHRVLGASGRLTGYSGAGGIDTKRRLLDWEQGQPGIFS